MTSISTKGFFAERNAINLKVIRSNLVKQSARRSVIVSSAGKASRFRPRLAAKLVNVVALQAARSRLACRTFGHWPRTRLMKSTCVRCGVKMERVPEEHNLFRVG